MQWLACIRLAVAAAAICLVYIEHVLRRSEGLDMPSAISGAPSPWGSVLMSGGRAIPLPRISFHQKNKKKRCIIQYLHLTTRLGELQPLGKGFPFAVASDNTSPSCKRCSLGILTSTTTTQARPCRWAAATACLRVHCRCRGTSCHYL